MYYDDYDYLLFIEVEGAIDIYGSVESGAPETEVNNYFVHLQHKKKHNNAK